MVLLQHRHGASGLKGHGLEGRQAKRLNMDSQEIQQSLTTSAARVAYIKPDLQT